MSESQSYGLAKVVRYLPRFLVFVFRYFPSARIALAVAALGVVIEYVALSAMLPLAGDAGRRSATASSIIDIWQTLAVQVGLPDSSRTWLWIFILLLGMRIVVSFIQLALNTWTSKRILAHLSGGAFSRVLTREPLTEIYRRTVGHYTSLAGDEAARVGQVFFNLAQMLSALFAAIIGLVVLYTFSPQVFNLTILFLMLSALGIGLAVKRVFLWSSESIVLSREANTTFIEAFNGIRSIRSMAGEEFVAERYRGFLTRYSRLLFYLDMFNYGSRALPGLILVMLGLVALFPSAGYFQEISAIYFFTVTTMLIRVLSFLGTVVSSGGRLAIDIRAAFDLDDIVGELPEQQVISPKIPVFYVHEITLTNLSCGYVREQPVLTDVVAQLRAGRCYALVGRSGSGKSTLSDVLLGLLTPISGKLYVEGLSYEQLNLASLRRRVVLVEQQTRIFSGTVRENIAFGLVLTDDEVKAAVEAAGLHEFIMDIPNGLEAHLDYQGANLSGGQRQRIGLARAIVRQPDVLILDEATSALDSQTRELVIKRLKEIFCARILVFITHDAHVIQVADEILHIRNGRLETEVRQVKV